MSISKETKIEFSLGWFIGTVISVMGTMISVFTAFYFVVQKPNNDSLKDQMNVQFELREKHLNEKFGHIDESLSGFSSGLSNINTQIGELSRRENTVTSSDDANQGGFGN